MFDDTEACAQSECEEWGEETYYRKPFNPFPERYRVKYLDNGIEAPKRRNEAAKVGEQCRCPMCGHKFTKKTYQQKFCSNKCKVNYHNKRQRYKY